MHSKDPSKGASAERVRIGRRQFLKRATTVGAVAAGFPYIVPSSALGFADTPAPSERITLGLIGLGRMMGNHHGTFLNNNATQILAVCDVEARRVAAYKQKTEEHYAKASPDGSYKGCDTYGDFRELCARPDIDAVVIATPNHWHTLTAITAPKKGKDI